MDIDRSLLMRCIALTIGAALVLLVPGGVVSSRFWKAIRTRHPEIWVRLGEPRLFGSDIQQSRRLRTFVQKREFEQLSDPEINAYGRLLRALRIVLIALFSFAAALVILASVTACR